MVKQFFKSTAVKSVAVLLAIVVVCGGLLAVCNDLLFLTDEERLSRAIAKIYGGNATVRELISLTPEESAFTEGAIEKAYLMSDGNYLLQARGNGGWQGGSITVWTVMDCEGSRANHDLRLVGVERVIYESNEKQSYISKFSQADYDLFTRHDGEVADGKSFGKEIDVVKTGESSPFTFGALTNAVNVALRFTRTTLVGEAPYEPLYAFEAWVNLEQCSFTVDADTGTLDCLLTTAKNAPAPSFQVRMKVVNGVITSYAHTGSFATSQAYSDRVDGRVLDGSLFVGMDKEAIASLIKEDGGRFASGEFSFTVDGAPLTTGATRSNESFLYAAAFALYNFDLLVNGGNE